MTYTGEARRAGRVLTFITLLLAITVLTACAGNAAHRHLSHKAPADPYLWLRDSIVEDNPRVVMVDKLPRVTYPGVVKPQENAVTITQYGLAHYSSGHPIRALRAADWLVRHQSPSGAWLYTFDFYVASVGDTLKGPWVSALGQGQALSLLVRAYRLTHDDKYLTAARKAMGPITTPVAKGGTYRTWHGHPFFEEYPTARPSYVMNGFVFTILGLRDLGVTGDKTAYRLWKQGERTLSLMIPQYAIGAADSAYSLGFKNPGGPAAVTVRGSVYASIHVQLMQRMAELTGRPVYQRMADKWVGAL